MSESEISELLVDRDGPVLVVTINRPEQMNALNSAVRHQLSQTWQAVKEDSSIRAVVFSGAGERAFCVGRDLRERLPSGGFEPTSADVSVALQLTAMQCDVWVPVVVAVGGVCAGAGLHFLADADVVIASSNATFVDTHVSVGQVAAIEPITLLPRIGLGNVLRLTVLGRTGRMDAVEALRIGLVDEVSNPSALMDRAMELARGAASGSPSAIEASKRAIWGAFDRPQRQALQYGWDLLLAHRAHPDATEGPRAFMEKRPPEWS